MLRRNGHVLVSFSTFDKFRKRRLLKVSAKNPAAESVPKHRRKPMSTNTDQVVNEESTDVLLEADDELLIEEISIDGMCGVY